MSTRYQKVMSQDGSTIASIYDTVGLCFIPLNQENIQYKDVLFYCSGLGITVNDLDLFTG